MYTKELNESNQETGFILKTDGIRTIKRLSAEEASELLQSLNFQKTKVTEDGELFRSRLQTQIDSNLQQVTDKVQSLQAEITELETLGVTTE